VPVPLPILGSLRRRVLLDGSSHDDHLRSFLTREAPNRTTRAPGGHPHRSRPLGTCGANVARSRG
jgi:hypothetical protein